MWVSLIFDGVIALLLGVTIFYCTLVNKRLSALRSGKDELKQVIEDLTVATTSAQMSIAHLKEAGREVVGTLEDDVRKGRALADELSLMLETGSNLANRLEGSRERGGNASGHDARVILSSQSDLHEGMEKPGVPPQVTVKRGVATPPKPTESEAGVAGRSVENELLKALRRAR